jgi:hypothetical protein
VLWPVGTWGGGRGCLKFVLRGFSVKSDFSFFA